MSRKKLLPRPEWRFFLEIQPTVVFSSLEKFGSLSVLMSFSADDDDAVEFERAASEMSDSKVNHGSIRGSWPMAISGYPRGHNVKWVTRCQARGADLID
jgi:hypothetical protein